MEDRLSSYADLPALEAEQTKIIKLVDDTITHIQTKQKELGNIQLTLLDANSAKQSTDAISKGKKAVDELTLSVREYKRLQDQLATTEAKLAVAQSDTAKSLAVTKVELQATNKLNRDGVSAYNDLQKELAAASRLYKDLAASRGLDNKATLEAQKRAKDLNDQLKAIDVGMGNYQRIVGNYSSATANLNRNIGVLATELPNAGISLRTFAQSLSNNITPFIASIKEVQASNKILQAEGKATTSVMKSLGQSLLSINVITGVAIAVGLKLIEYWQKGNKAAQDAEKAVTKYNEAIKNADETERSAAQQQVARLNILTSIAKDNAQGTRARTLAVEELQKTYPSTFGALSKQAILEGNLGDAVNRTTQALLDRAAAQAAEKKFAAASENVYDLTLAQRDAQKKLNAEQAKFDALTASASAKNASDGLRNRWVAQGSAVRGLQSDIKDLNKELEKATTEQKTFLKDAQENAAKAGDILFNSGSAKGGSGGGAKERTSKITEEAVNQAQIIVQQLNDVKEAELRMQEEQLGQLLVNLDERKISLEEYNRQKEQITKETESRILDFQIKALEDYLKSEGLKPKEIAAIQEKITNITISQIEKRNAAMEAAIKNEVADEEKANAEKLKNLEGFQSAMYKSKEAADKKELELAKKIERAKQQIIKESELLVREILGLVSDAYQRQIDELTAIGEQIDINKNKEVKAVEDSTLAIDEKARRVAEIEAVSVAEREKNERKIADIKLKQARLDKAAALANIIESTAVAIMNAVKLPPPFGTILAAIVGTTGALQFARVASTPLPKYADGTTNHKGGLAILGDGKEHELVIEPNKKPYWSADTDTIYNLPKHTQVIPESKLGSAITQPSNKDVVMAVMEMSGLIDGGLNKLNKTIRNKETVRLEAKNRRWQDYYYENAKA